MAISLSGLYVATFGLETCKPEIRPPPSVPSHVPVAPLSSRLSDEFMVVVTSNDN